MRKVVIENEYISSPSRTPSTKTKNSQNIDTPVSIHTTFLFKNENNKNKYLPFLVAVVVI